MAQGSVRSLSKVFVIFKIRGQLGRFQNPGCTRCEERGFIILKFQQKLSKLA